MKRFALLVALGYLLVQLAGLGSVGLTDDDDFYIPAGIGYAEWLGDALRFADGAWSRPRIDAAFTPNREHPPLAKYVFGISHFAFRGLFGPYDAARVGTVLFSTLCAALMLFLAMSHLGERRGFRAGLFAVLMLLTLPRFYFHSHAATLDVPVAAMYLASATLALRAERSRRAAWWAGPVFGLANATKLNAPFMLLAYLPFVLLTRVGRAPKGTGLRLPPLPSALLSMALIGPLVFFLVWPWIWSSPIDRLAEYVKFHVHHYGIYFLYFGRVYSSDPFAPWSAPFLMAASTIPLATSVLAIAGLLGGLPAVLRRLLVRGGADDPLRREGDLVLFVGLNALTTISIVAFAGTPIYGGEKLFMPFFPFWCLLAGYGANLLLERLEAELTRPRLARAVAIGGSISGLLLQLKFGEYALSQYNGLAGGLAGATATGFERQYYDIAFRDLARWLSAEAPPNLAVHFLPNNWEYVRTYRWYRRDGRVREDLRVVDQETQADWIVLTHERRFARYAEDLQRHRGKKILAEKIVDGVPIWTVLDARAAGP